MAQRKFKSFQDELLHARNKKGWTQDRLASALIAATGEKSRSWISDLENKPKHKSNDVPKELAIVLSCILGLGYTSLRQITDKYSASRLISVRAPGGGRKKSGIDLGDESFDSIIHAIRSKQQQSVGDLREQFDLTIRLTSTLNNRHSLLGITSGMRSQILDHPYESRCEEREARFAGLKNGMLWALVIPTAEFLKRLMTDPEKAQERYHELKNGFTTVVEYFARQIPGIEAQTRLFECDDLQFTAYWWTTSLIGWQQDGTEHRAVIVRAPYNPEISYHLIPPNPEFERQFQAYCQDVLTKAAGDDTATCKWVESFFDRMVSRQRL